MFFKAKIKGRLYTISQVLFLNNKIMLKKNKSRWLILLITSVCFYPAFAQSDTAEARIKEEVFSIGLGVQHGFIFAHSEAVQNTKGARPTGVEVTLSWQRTDSAAWNLCNCYPRKGLLVSYYDYDTKILGKSLTAAYFLEPTYKINNRTFFSFRGAGGFSYLTNPFDSLKNPANQSYSTSMSVYLLVGVGVWYQLSEKWWLNSSANYQHESNGGMREPNKGINWPTAGIALSYQPKSANYFTGIRTSEKFWTNKKIRLDAALFGVARRTQTESGSRRKALVGFSANASKQVGRINALTAGAEIYKDAKLSYRLKNDSIEASSIKAGLLAGHEFLLGKFIFSQQLGVYVFDQTPYYDRLYHRWGLIYNVSNKIGAGINLKAHKQVAEFADFRFIYRL
jgi:hypothetical protein